MYANQEHIEKWTQYRDARRADYNFRARTRYAYVAELLFMMGLKSEHTVIDVGAGTCGFGRYLHSKGWHGIYNPVDAVVSGEDLERWTPRHRADFYVSIETLEHLTEPYKLLDAMADKANIGLVITTPNPAAVDVLNCDPTHKSVLRGEELRAKQLAVRAVSWFGVEADTLVAFGRTPLGELY